MTYQRMTSATRGYVTAMAAAREIQAPYGALLLTLLTTARPLHELLAPATAVVSGTLAVDPAALTRGSPAARVPTSQTLAALLSEGGVADRLGLVPADIPTVDRRLHEQLTDRADLFGAMTAEQIRGLALEGLVSAAGTSNLRIAVLVFAGIQSDERPGGCHGTPVRDSLQQVASLVDYLARHAGYRVPEPHALESA